MARRRSRSPHIARGRGKGNYNFTYKRKAALYRAAKISAQKRRNRRIKIGVGVAGGILAVGGAAYLGHRHGGKAVDSVRNFKPQIANARNAMVARIAVLPGVKEAVRKSEAISPPAKRKAGLRKPGVKRTTIPAEDPQAVRNRDTPYRPPGHHQKIDENTLEIIDKTDKYLPRELVKGRKIKQSTIEKALKADNAARAASGNKGTGASARTTAEDSAIVNAMIADGTVRRTTKGRRAKKRTNPKAKQKPGQVHGGLTESEWEAALGFDAPQKTTSSGTNVVKATTGRSVAPKATTGTKTKSKLSPEALKAGTKLAAEHKEKMRRKPGHGSKVGGWEHMNAEQRQRARDYAKDWDLIIEENTGLYKERKK